MSLASLASSDTAAILTLDGTPVTLTSPGLTATVYQCHGLVNRTGIHIDADGIMVSGERTEVTLSLRELASLGLSDPETLKSGDWLISTTDVTGSTVSGKIASPLLDRTAGRVTFFIKVSS